MVICCNNKILNILSVFICFFLIVACGSGSDSENKNTSNNRSPTGTYLPLLLFPPDVPPAVFSTDQFADIDCAAAGISTFEFSFAINGTFIGPYEFDCTAAAEAVMITDLPVGAGIQVDADAYDENGSTLFTGQETVDIQDRQITQSNGIVMERASGTDTDTSTQTDTDSGNGTDTDTSTSTGLDAESFTNGYGMTFVRIEPGEFTMGSPLDEIGRRDREMPHHMVITRPYYIQTTELTQRQWAAVSEDETFSMSIDHSYFVNCGMNCPVESVTYDQALGFLSELNMKDDSSPCVYRLPTEAEWEYAARAGSGTGFANGEITLTACSLDPVLDSMSWYCANSEVNYDGCVPAEEWRGDFCGGTHPVAQKGPNAWGLYDMHGNVREWCQDWFADYPENPEPDYAGPETGIHRVIRGGAWDWGADAARSAFRNGGFPDVVPDDYLEIASTGFRIVCEPVEE